MSICSNLRTWAKRIKRDGVTLWFAGKHPRTPWYAKALGVFVVAYALSPIDLIPDFIPVLGYVDDVLLLPGLIWLTALTRCASTIQSEPCWAVLPYESLIKAPFQNVFHDFGVDHSAGKLPTHVDTSRLSRRRAGTTHLLEDSCWRAMNTALRPQRQRGR